MNQTNTEIKIYSEGLSDKEKEDKNDIVFSYLTLRNLIGISGILLPVILFTFTQGVDNEIRIQRSISAYYYTNVGDIFVIVLCLLSAFLLTYKGYRLFEKILLLLSSLSGFGLVLYPTQWRSEMLLKSVHEKQTEVPKIFFGIEVHWMFAALFFISLSLICIFYFTKSNEQAHILKKGDGQMLTQKSWRNIVYVAMGSVMILSMAVILLYAVVDPFKQLFGDFSLIFFMETLAIWAFGVAWITKGETLFPDKGKTSHIKKMISLTFNGKL